LEEFKEVRMDTRLFNLGAKKLPTMKPIKEEKNNDTKE